MAIVSNTFLTFDAIGNREDLIEKITDVSPLDCPFTGMIGKTRATSRLHEWQEDSLAAADVANAQIEGDEVSFTAVVPTTRPTNRTQILAKTIIVSGTQDAVNKAGRKKETVYQISKMGKELKRDREAIFTSNNAPVTGNSGTASEMRPLVGWYTTNTSAGSGGSNGTSSAARTDGTQRAFTEDMLKTVIQACYNEGGNPDTIMTGLYNKTVLSGFSGNRTAFEDASKKTLTTTVEVYVSDFGTHKVIANRFQRARDVHVLDVQYWKAAQLRPLHTKPLAATGDHEKGYILEECTLEALNQRASGIVADLTTS